jgi:molecular chaperone Hsp33
MKEFDQLRRFAFTNLGVRGEWVSLQHSWQAAIEHQPGNAVVQSLLGEALAAVVLLSATIKYKGSLILQIQGNGALKTLVTQCTHERTMRGLVRGDVEVAAGSLADLFGEGFMVLTVESEAAEPYQGIVPLEGQGIAQALQTYFVQSEQLQTRLWLFANQTQAVGLFLQEMPSQGTYKEDWARIELLANTVTAQELLDLSCEQLLYRLFNEEQVVVYDPEPVSFKCQCSVAKIEQTLASIGHEELSLILAERGEIDVDCEFCGHHYRFIAADVARICNIPLV